MRKELKAIIGILNQAPQSKCEDDSGLTTYDAAAMLEKLMDEYRLPTKKKPIEYTFDQKVKAGHTLAGLCTDQMDGCVEVNCQDADFYEALLSIAWDWINEGEEDHAETLLEYALKGTLDSLIKDLSADGLVYEIGDSGKWICEDGRVWRCEAADRAFDSFTGVYMHLQACRYCCKSICFCGHTGDGDQSDHNGHNGHGACAMPDCTCQQFTWEKWTPEYKREKGLK